MARLQRTAMRGTLLVMLCAMPISCAEYAASPSLQDALQELPIGEPVMVETLLGSDVKAVCVLQPYQNQLTTRDGVADTLNAQIRAEALAADEGHFIFAIARKSALELERIKRSNQLDIFGLRQLPAGSSLPDHFVQAECSPVHTAAIVKIIYLERAYVVFGAIPR